MTDTPLPGAAAAARAIELHDDSGLVERHVLADPRRLSAEDARALLYPEQPAPAVHDLDAIMINASPLKPQLLALARWVMHGLGMWLILHGLSQGQEAALEPILTGLTLSSAALGWSVLQKDLASHRIHLAAAADPAKVVLR